MTAKNKFSKITTWQDITEILKAPSNWKSKGSFKMPDHELVKCKWKKRRQKKRLVNSPLKILGKFGSKWRTNLICLLSSKWIYALVGIWEESKKVTNEGDLSCQKLVLVPFYSTWLIYLEPSLSTAQSCAVHSSEYSSFLGSSLLSWQGLLKFTLSAKILIKRGMGKKKQLKMQMRSTTNVINLAS